MLLECQGTCIINRSNTTKYFKLWKGLENAICFHLLVCFMSWNCVHLIKPNKRVNGINIFEDTYFYSAYADDTTFS